VKEVQRVNPIYFKSPTEFRRWLAKNYDKQSEVWIGMYKVSSGKKGITYNEALDEALCYGWIDGVRKSADAESYMQRFSPRTAKSYWSAVNTKRVAELTTLGRMHASGVAAFERRDKTATARYSFERETAALEPSAIKHFRANKAAWQYFDSEAPWYRRVAVHWVTSAKKPETRQRRLGTLIRDSAAGRRIGALPQRKKKVERVSGRLKPAPTAGRLLPQAAVAGLRRWRVYRPTVKS
jgi:uncharacterized protein YdeI (YjbR/CyaY-like superfamily)